MQTICVYLIIYFLLQSKVDFFYRLLTVPERNASSANGFELELAYTLGAGDVGSPFLDRPPVQTPSSYLLCRHVDCRLVVKRRDSLRPLSR